MIKLKKIVAIAMAATMCMGLGITASAVDRGARDATLVNWNLQSPYYTADPNTNTTTGNGTKIEATNAKGEENPNLTLTGNGLVYDSKAYNSINTAEEVAAIFEKNNVGVPAGTDIIPIAAGVVNSIADNDTNVLTFTLPGSQFNSDPYIADANGLYTTGDEVWGMFETGQNTGVWEMRSGVVNANGQVDFNIDHTGSFVLIKTMKNGRLVAIETVNGQAQPPVVVDPTDNQNPIVTPEDPNASNSQNPAAGQNSASNTNTAASTWTSPKTGEF